MKIIVSHFFLKAHLERVKYNVCKVVKHKRNLFLLSSGRSAIPFYWIHSDIWGLFVISNILGKRWLVIFYCQLFIKCRILLNQNSKLRYPNSSVH